MDGGDDSEFWRLLDRHDVDLYLAGEMHDMTTLTQDGVVQVVHGALATWGEANYLVGRVFADRIELTPEGVPGARTRRAQALEHRPEGAGARASGSSRVPRRWARW